MKKTKNILAFLTILGVFFVPMLVGAQFDPTREASNANLSTKSAYSVVTTVLKTGLVALTVLAVIGFIISGIIFVTAGGASKQDTARKWLTSSIIGIIVGLIGYIVIGLISNILSGTVQTS